MLRIYSVSEAKASILDRSPAAAGAYDEEVLASVRRIFGAEHTPETAVAHLLEDVRSGGDAAIRRWTLRIDGVSLGTLRVSEEEIQAACGQLPADLLDVLRRAAERIRRFHECQPVPNWTTTELGGVLGQRYTPMRRAGLYVPGGSAPLPSSLLMAAIPAQVAGVSEIAVATPSSSVDGGVAAEILGAAAVAGVTEIYRLGGALAIAALAYGTESVPAVDKIAGPGGLFTTLAKKQVYGTVGIDGIYGPTETAVIADESARPAWVAADLLAQAEHDILASAVLFTPSAELAAAVQHEVARQIEDLSRSAIIARSLARRGGIVLVSDLDEACRLAGDYAAEHTCIAVEEDQLQRCAAAVGNAGGLFLGERSFEVLGDYVAGPSHIMPTGGTARFASPLNVLDFMKMTTVVQLDITTSTALAPTAATIARAEGLTAHQAAALIRMEANNEPSAL